jgi:fucose permease
LAEKTGSTLSQISLIFTVNSLGYILGSLLAGLLYDRRPSHPILALILLMACALLAVVPILPSLILVILVFMVLGFGLGFIDVAGNTLLVWVFGRDVGPYMNALHLMFGIGALLSPLMIDRVVVISGDINWAYWLLALLTLPMAAWLWITPSPTQPETEKHQEGAGRAASGAFTGLIILLAGLMFMHVGAELSFGNWIFSYASALGLGTATTARLLNSLYWGSLTVGRLIAIPIATWLRPRTILLINLLVAITSIALILLLPGWPLALWVGTAGFGLAIASMFPTTITFAERRMPITGTVTGYILVGANAGSMFLPWLIGQFFTSVGPTFMMIAIGFSIIAALGLFGALFLSTRNMTQREAASE